MCRDHHTDSMCCSYHKDIYFFTDFLDIFVFRRINLYYFDSFFGIIFKSMFYDITEVFYYQGQFIHCLKKKQKKRSTLLFTVVFELIRIKLTLAVLI